MSAVCILTPVVIAAWPAFSAAVTAAAASLGYQLVAESTARQTETVSQRVELEIAQSEIVTGTLGRDQRIRLSRDGVTVVFSRDARGRASVCVTGEGHSDAELQALGEELSQRVVQQYVYQRLMDEMRTRGYNVVEEQVDENQAIRLKVRHWEN
ncbi:MAG: DUF1257 domain-containing protein [Verrucomicrobiales bacterium]|nr:DUF1257 domain-containing protein [Verrucomicrobiales bacterium]